LVRQIESLGYAYSIAEDGDRAVALLDTETFALVLTDIVMPGQLDGMALAKLIAQRWPATKIILTSGYADSRLDGNDASLPAGVRFLAKPYRVAQLAAVMREALTDQVG
jgi:CheY-like chemotaxis protein